MTKRAIIATLAGSGIAVSAGAQNTHTFLIPIPEIGQEFFFDSSFIPLSTDFDGGTVIDARLDLTLQVEAAPPGDTRISDAAHFDANIIVPVDILPAPGTQAGVVDILGSNEGLSGTGLFNVSRSIDHLIGGKWDANLFFTASTYYGIDADHVVIGTVFPFESSFVSITVQQIPAPASASVFGLALIAARRRR
ncbi:MAG: hypothetical protein ACIAQ0_14075 [Phycisphaerales bacterium JB058]